MENWLNRTINLIGNENMEKIQNSNIVIFGCGGVGSYVIEGLVRAGINNITIIDNDTVDLTNINRQLIATTSSIGKDKVDIVKQRCLDINPTLNISTFKVFADGTNILNLIPIHTNYIIDAIDSVSSKISIIEYAHKLKIPIISCMGTGNKLNPSLFEITDISKTSVCPLAKTMRKELKIRNIQNIDVLYSKEIPIKDFNHQKNIPSSISFVPSVAGLLICSYVINKIICF